MYGVLASGANGSPEGWSVGGVIVLLISLFTLWGIYRLVRSFVTDENYCSGCKGIPLAALCRKCWSEGRRRCVIHCNGDGH